MSALTMTASTAVALSAKDFTFQATVTGTGSVTATVVVEVSNDLVGWITAGTITLSDTTTATDGLALSAKWAYARYRRTALTGTGAVCTVTMGV